MEVNYHSGYGMHALLMKSNLLGLNYFEINIYWMGGLLMKQKMVGWNFNEIIVGWIVLTPHNPGI